MKLGVNTFGLGPYLKKDREGTLKGLMEAGITALEPMLYVGTYDEIPEAFLKAAEGTGAFEGYFDPESAEKTIAEWRNMGFDISCIHIQKLRFTSDFTYELVFTKEMLEQVISFMKKNDIHYAVHSFMESSVSRMRGYKEILIWAAQTFREHGLEILLHNHTHEWMPDGDTCVMEWLFEEVPQIRHEIDVGWATYAGVDAASILLKYPELFPVIHIKDIMAGKDITTGEPFCTAPGEGILPLEEVIMAAKTLLLDDRALIIDQDDSANGDIVGDIARGAANVRRLWEA